MFQESLVESTSLLRAKSRWPVIVSVAAQAVVLIVAVAVPLVHPEALSLGVKSAMLPLPPVPKPPAPPKPVHVEVTQAAASTPAVPTVQAETPSHLRSLQSTLPRESDTPAIAMISMAGDPGSSPLGAGMPGPAAPHIVVAKPRVPAAAGPQHVSSGVSAGLLLAPILPVYPSIARSSRVEGTVVVHAVISRSGHVERAEVVSGNGLLRGAALDAVRNARYRPYLLNGEATEVETTFTIVFHLG